VCALAQDFLQEQDYPGEHVFRKFSEAPAEMRTTLEQPHFTYIDLLRPGLPGGAIFQGFLGDTAGNPAPGGNPGQKLTRLNAIFKKCIVKTTLN
jgi:hypothetical protein